MRGCVFYLAFALVHHCGGVCPLESLERPGLDYHSIAKHQSPYSGLILPAILYCIPLLLLIFFQEWFWHKSRWATTSESQSPCESVPRWTLAPYISLCLHVTQEKKYLSNSYLPSTTVAFQSAAQTWRCLWAAHLLAITVTSTSIFPLNPSHPS